MAVPISNSTKSVPNQYGIVKTQNIRITNEIVVQLAAEEMKKEKAIDPKTVHLYDVLEIKMLGTGNRNSSVMNSLPSTISIAKILQNANDHKGNPYILPDTVNVDGVMRHTKNSEGRQIAHTIDGIIT